MLLGTIISNYRKWVKNTDFIVKKSYARMELLRKLAGFNAPINDMKHIYITYTQSLSEQSSNFWHNGLFVQNENDLEKVQQLSFKLILKEKYHIYENALNTLDLETLKDRRTYLSIEFARKCLKSEQVKSLFRPNSLTPTMSTLKCSMLIQKYYRGVQKYICKVDKIMRSKEQKILTVCGKI